MKGRAAEPPSRRAADVGCRLPPGFCDIRNEAREPGRRIPITPLPGAGHVEEEPQGDLSPKSKKITSKEAAAVRGGKGVRDKDKYMVVKLKEAFVTS